MQKLFSPAKRTVSTREKAPGDRHWLYGKHACSAALQNDRRKIFRVLASKNAYDGMPLLAALPYPVEIVDNRRLEQCLPPGSVHQGIAVETQPLAEMSLEAFCRQEHAGKSVVLLLDQVTDPHNVGAILRSAAAFGAEAVITTERNAAQETGTLAKAASGALELVPFVRVTNLAAAMALLKESGYWLLGLDGYAERFLPEVPPYEKTVLILGSEEKGLRRLTREHADLLVKLPISATVESLNVSTAAAVALYVIAAK